MKPAGWMVGASVVSWLIIARVAGAGTITLQNTNLATVGAADFAFH